MRSGRLSKKLDRQSRLSKLVLEVAQIGFGIPTEAGPQSSAVASAFKAAAKPTPALPVPRRQIAGLDRPQARNRGRNQPNRAAKHQAWGGALASRGATLVMTLGSEQRHQI